MSKPIGDHLKLIKVLIETLNRRTRTQPQIPAVFKLKEEHELQECNLFCKLIFQFTFLV
jgi:hypothetical protein